LNVNVWDTIVQLSKERGVDTEVIVQAIEESLKVASSKYFTHNEKINISFTPEKGELRVYTLKKVSKNPQNLYTEISLEKAKEIDASAITGKYVEIDLPSKTLGRIAAQAAKQVILQKVRNAEQEKIYKQFAPRLEKIITGKYVEIDLPSKTLGRIAAQAAKQVILQKVRNAEQEKIYKQFAPRLEKIVTGVLRRFETNKNMILEANKTDVLFPYQEKLKNEEFKRGDRIKAIIIQVLKENQGPQVIVSRADSKFLAKLLELETPEIANGNIEIKDIVRQPGERAKVSVLSKEKDIDPIGACIGVKGNRILAISKELNGEKIDIIKWSDNPISYTESALSPAKIEKIFILNKKEKRMQAVVSKDQLSLAIGKKGMNVRLASRLVGWKIEIEQE